MELKKINKQIPSQKQPYKEQHITQINQQQLRQQKPFKE